MKYLILFLISFSALANFVKESELTSGITMVYLKANDCGSDCIRIPKGYNKAFHKKEEIQVYDYDNPIVSKSEAESCQAVADDPATTETDESKTIEEDCQEKLAAKVCTDPDEWPVKVLDAGAEEVYCTKTTYPLIGSGRFHVVEDPALKASYDAAQAVKAADEAAMQAALKAADCGKRVKARMLVQNAPKGLSNGQKKQLVNTYRDINDLLSSGSLDAAKAEIQAVTADGTIVTNADKTALVAELDACK